MKQLKNKNDTAICVRGKDNFKFYKRLKKPALKAGFFFNYFLIKEKHNETNDTKFSVC